MTDQFYPQGRNAHQQTRSKGFDQFWPGMWNGKGYAPVQQSDKAPPMKIYENNIADLRVRQSDALGRYVKISDDDRSEVVYFAYDLKGVNAGMKLERLLWIPVMIGEGLDRMKDRTRASSQFLSHDMPDETFKKWLIGLEVLQQVLGIEKKTVKSWCDRRSSKSGVSIVVNRTLDFEEELPAENDIAAVDLENFKNEMAMRLAAIFTAGAGDVSAREADRDARLEGEHREVVGDASSSRPADPMPPPSSSSVVVPPALPVISMDISTPVAARVTALEPPASGNPAPRTRARISENAISEASLP